MNKVDKMKYLKAPVAVMAIALAAMGCNSSTSGAKNTDNNASATEVILGNFNADSAYQYVADQLAFGPRVPGSEGHRLCRDYIVSKVNGADSVIVQEAVVTAFNGDKLPISNIIACYNTASPRHILLAAHWDTRPWADMDADESRRNEPIPGANDGGSGVAVLLEIARNFAEQRPSIGVDLIFFDAEDYGNSGFGDTSDSWCLGSQYWAANMTPYTPGNLPEYGILLDMVGGRDARFHYEAFSQLRAAKPVAKIWGEAERLGYGEIFPRTVGGAITDDHIVLIKAGIPTADIIESNNIETGTFAPTWHTHSDNLDNIDKNTLKAVGQTVLNIAYKEK